MRVLCLLLFCLSAVAALRLGYRRGFRYSYRYEGWVAHGIPDALEKDLALKITAITHLDYFRTGFVMMTLEDVRLAKLADKVLYNDRLETNLGLGEDLDADVARKLKTCLEFPIKFQFKNGALETEITTEEESREYCVNIQRAILNHLYLPVKNNEQTYQVRENEVTVLGKCKTVYNIIAEKPYYKVKRVIDLTKCLVRPGIYQISLPNTDAFYLKRVGRGTAKELPIFLRTAAYIHYDLQGDKMKGFLIAKVVSEDVEELTLNGDQYQGGKAVGAHTKQVLTLIAKEQPLPASPKEFMAEKKRGLIFVFDHDKTEIESVDGQDNILTQVRVHIHTINQHLETGNIKAETAIEFTRLVSMLRHCTAKTLMRIFEEEIMACTNLDVRRLVLDAMARIGTEAAGVVLKDIVTTGKVNKELKRIVFGVGWVRGLDTGFIKQVVRICEHQVVAANINIHRGCWLSLGTLVNRLMVKMRQNPRMGQDIRLVTLRQLIAKAIKEAILNTTNNEIKITYLKAVGNAGWMTKDVFRVVSDLITTIKTPLHVRVQAIWALRHMARVKPVMVRQKLLPVLANPLRDPEERISAYKVMIQNDPSLLVCQMIASVIAREAAGLGPRSNQLVSFIASDLRTSINYDNIDIVKSSRARLLLRLLPRVVAFDLFSYSKGINVPIDAGNNVMMELRVNKINAPQTFIPRHIHTKIKFNMPGVSANFFEFGVRMQGIHDILQQFFGPKGNRQKRSLDTLRYIFGTTTDTENDVRDEKNRFQEKLAARVAAYFKMYGSEILYGKMAEADLLEIIRDALIGGKTATEGGCTFTAENIKCDMPFTRAHLISEKRYMIPTLVGIPLKYSGKVAAVVKGRMAVNVNGLSQLLQSKFDQIQAKVLVKPTIVLHMHQKVGIWLPILETGVIVKHDLLSAPNINLILTVNQKGFKLEAPIATAEQQLLVLKPDVHGVMRKEVTAGIRKWKEIRLQLMTRGFIDIPLTCYGQEYINLMVCEKGRIVNPEYLRLKRLPIVPYGWLNTRTIVLRSDRTNPPKKIEAGYEITTNTNVMYEGMGTIKVMDDTKVQTDITMAPKCDETKWKCTTKWTFKHKKCPTTCEANMIIDYSQANRLTIDTTYGGDKEMKHEVFVKGEGKILSIVNTWNKLPDWVHKYVRLNRPSLIAFFRRFFSVEGAIGPENRSDITVKLFNKFVADIFVDTPTLKLRRINQALPIAINSFERKQKIGIIKRFYGACVVKCTNHIETTDNVVIKEELPGRCPFVLAEDARGVQTPEWRILLRKAEGGGQILIAEVGPRKIEFGKDKTVKVDGQKIELKPGMNVVPGGKVQMIDNQLYFKADFGFECLFDGATTVVVFTPWWHNRIRGICGNNDGEYWTDFLTRRKTFMPEIMAKEFLREWAIDGKKCKLCKLEKKHIKLGTDVDVRKNKVCFTIGQFLRCMAPCSVRDQHTIEKVPYHCLNPKSPLIAKIEAGDPTVALETMSVDAWRPVVEHLTCTCI